MVPKSDGISETFAPSSRVSRTANDRFHETGQVAAIPDR